MGRSLWTIAAILTIFNMDDLQKNIYPEYFAV
jgi:hypothetical protein